MSFNKLNLENFIANHYKDGQLFLLVDGAQIDHSQLTSLEHTYGECIYLFKGTYEEEAYQCGPILFDLSQLDLFQVENQIKLNIELEDGGIGILRYYDPRVLNRLSLIFTSDQKKQLLEGFESISFMLNELSYELKYND